MRAILKFSKYGVPQSGLTPSFDFIRQVEDNADITPLPDINELGDGFYYFDYDLMTNIYFQANSGDPTIPAMERTIVGDLCSHLFIGVIPVKIFTKESDLTTPIPDVIVVIENDTGDVILTHKTNENGELSIALDEGTYNVYAFKTSPNFRFTNPYTIEVTDTEKEFDIIGYRLFERILPDPQLCQISGKIILVDGKPAVRAEVSARVVNFPSVTIITDDEIKAYTNKKGYFKMTVVQGAEINFQVPSLGFAKQFIVPYQSSLKLEDIMEQPSSLTTALGQTSQVQVGEEILGDGTSTEFVVPLDFNTKTAAIWVLDTENSYVDVSRDPAIIDFIKRARDSIADVVDYSKISVKFNIVPNNDQFIIKVIS